MIESADKTLALGDRVEPASRYQAYYGRAYAYISLPVTDPMFKEPLQAQKAREAAMAGLNLLNDLAKPDNLAQMDFDKSKSQVGLVFKYAAGLAAFNMKDYQSAIDLLKPTRTLNPGDGHTSYKIGVAYGTAGAQISLPVQDAGVF